MIVLARKKVIASIMQWILLLLLTRLSHARLYPTSCTEDSQCSSGFYCEDGAHFCRECIRCDELKRETLPLRDVCVKSVLECGACLDGLVQEYEELMGGQCVPPGGRSVGKLLPPYAWVAIGVSLLLVILILFVFVKINSSKILYSSHTSVQSTRTVEGTCTALPPPPYNDVDVIPPSSPPQLSPPPDNADLETSKLIELSHPCAPSPETPPAASRFREKADSQTARVFNNPTYARVSQNIPSDASEIPTSVLDENETRSTSIFLDGQQEGQTITDGTLNLNENEDKCTSNAVAALLRKNCTDSEDSNNNVSEESSYHRSSNNAQYLSNVLTGPSFVINVVENINNLQQHNKNNATEFQYSLNGMNSYS